jgi:protein-tyrosine phosphatase
LKALLDKLRRIVTKTEVEPNEESEESAFAYTILFVCMGNICRSPTAEGAFKHVLAERAPDLSIRADSAGTHAYHVGHPPDPRAQRAAERRGIDLSEQKARRVQEEDFASFDLVIAMDELNLEVLVELSPPEYHDRIKLFLDYAPQLGRRDVPDPYYGGNNGFELVLDLIEDASIGLLEQLRDKPIVRGESPASS